MVKLGSMLAVCPPMMRRDLGPWSPWGRFMRTRRRFDAIIASLIAEARADPAIDERSDVLTLLLQARYQDGEPAHRRRIVHAAGVRSRDHRRVTGLGVGAP
jgi:cytochrome P450